MKLCQRAPRAHRTRPTCSTRCRWHVGCLGGHQRRASQRRPPMTHRHLLSVALLATAFAACTSQVVDEDGRDEGNESVATTTGAGGSTSGPSSTATGPATPCGDKFCLLIDQC